MSLDRRIFGVETEFGCLVRDEDLGPTEHIVDTVKNHVFYQMKLGAIDLVSRNEAFEPARSGGFLINGGRLYVDAVGSHQEYATPECSDLATLVAHDKAGHRILLQSLEDLELADKVAFYNNSVDHFGGHTFGCHENYLVRVDESFFGEPIEHLYPFLVTRQIFAGVGRVGGHELDRRRVLIDAKTVMQNPIDYIWVPNVYSVFPDPTVRYQLSQRADHIIRAAATRVRFNRAIINPKWDDFYSYNSMSRLHLLYGEANMSEYAYALKIGTTALVLDLLEDDLLPYELRFDDELDVVLALRDVSRDPDWKWPVTLADDLSISAVDLQRWYLRLAQKYSGRNAQTDWVLREWQATLDALERDPMSLSDRLDWVAKYKIIQAYMVETGDTWESDALHSVDMEYHNIDPRHGLYYALERSGQVRRVCDEMNIIDAITESPSDTRALGRASLVKELIARKTPRYWVDWDMVAIEGGKQLPMRDPLASYLSEAAAFAKQLPGRRGASA